MTRDHKILGSALALATLSLICLEVAQANDAATANAPAALAEALSKPAPSPEASPSPTAPATPAEPPSDSAPSTQSSPSPIAPDTGSSPAAPTPAPSTTPAPTSSAAPAPAPSAAPPVAAPKPKAPAQYGVTVIKTTSDKGKRNGPIHTFLMNLLLDENGDAAGLVYFKQGNERARCKKDESQQNCRISLRQLQENFVTLESMQGESVIAIQVDSKFSPVHGGLATLRYLVDGTQGIKAQMSFELKRDAGNWSAHTTGPKSKSEHFVGLNFKTNYQNLGLFGTHAVGIEKIEPVLAPAPRP